MNCSKSLSEYFRRIGVGGGGGGEGGGGDEIGSDLQSIIDSKSTAL